MSWKVSKSAKPEVDAMLNFGIIKLIVKLFLQK